MDMLLWHGPPAQFKHRLSSASKQNAADTTPVDSACRILVVPLRSDATNHATASPRDLVAILLQNTLVLLSTTTFLVRDETRLEDRIVGFAMNSPGQIVLRLANGRIADFRVSVDGRLDVQPSTDAPPPSEWHVVTNGPHEVMLDGRIVLVDPHGQLCILSGSTRQLLSSTKLPAETLVATDNFSLLWTGPTNANILVVACRGGELHGLLYKIVRFVSSSNGNTLPLVGFTDQQVFVHRGPLCHVRDSPWMELRLTELWDVLDSQVGPVVNVIVNETSDCLMVQGITEVALCDFTIRRWRRLSFQPPILARWIGSDHLVVLLSTTQLLLVSRHDVHAHTVEMSTGVVFMDTCNSHLLLLTANSILAYRLVGDGLVAHSVFSLTDTDTPVSVASIRQLALIGNETLLLQDERGLHVHHQNTWKTLPCSAFLILPDNLLLLLAFNCDGNALALHQLDTGTQRPLSMTRLCGFYPRVSCLTVLSCDAMVFSLRTPLTSAFLLPDILVMTQDVNLLRPWTEDPVYSVLLEYLLLEADKSSDGFLAQLDQFHRHENANSLARALVAVSRKIEVHDASLLFTQLPSFPPEHVVQVLLDGGNRDVTCNDDSLLNFLPYLAKSYFEAVEPRRIAIRAILERLMAHRRLHRHLPRIRAYLSAFADLQVLFDTILQDKLTVLWTGGRVLKTHHLLQSLKTSETSETPETPETPETDWSFPPADTNTDTEMFACGVAADLLAVRDRREVDACVAWLRTVGHDSVVNLVERARRE